MRIDSTPVNFTLWEKLKEKSPRVHCITNFVTMHDVANILLAVHASPSMTREFHEVEEMVTQSHALVLNLGAIGDLDSMLLAGKVANAFHIPVILDPVACSATAMRREGLQKLLHEVHIDIIRGNATEMRHVMGLTTEGKAVDASSHDHISRDEETAILRAMMDYAKEHSTTLVLTGKDDLIAAEDRCARVSHGRPIMTRVTGTGCMMSGVLAAMATVGESFEAALLTAILWGQAAERADDLRKKEGAGTMTFRILWMDLLSRWDRFDPPRVHIYRRSR